MSKLAFRIQCPKCKAPAKAIVGSDSRKLLIYTCKGCHSHVVHYKDRTETISGKLFRKLASKGRLVLCGSVFFSPKTPITYDDVIDLKILLETEKDSASVLAKI
jgi:hypothetical protein